MKIIFLIHQFYPEAYTGTEKFVLNIARMMQRLGNKVKVITYSFYEGSDYDHDEGGILFRELTYRGIPVLALKYRRIPEDIHTGLRNNELRRLAKAIVEKEAPDLVHVGHPMRITELIRAASELGVPYVMTLTDYWLLCPKFILVTSEGSLCPGPDGGAVCGRFCKEFRGPFIETRLNECRKILEGAAGLFSPSRFLASMFEKEYTGLKVKVLPHGISRACIRENLRKYEGGEPVTFLYGGSFNEFKGVHVLVEAFRKLPHDHIGLEVYGSGPTDAHRDRLMELAKGDSRIRFKGVYEENEVGDILNGTDVVVIPSLWYENYPLVLHEALACRVPVVASGVGGMAEKIKDGENGFTFAVGDSDALMKVLDRISRNPEILNGIKGNKERFFVPTVEQEAFLYQREYMKVLS